MGDTIRWYDDHATELSRLYETVDAEELHASLLPALPAAPALALDVGCGTGRDAAWLAAKGIEVVAVDPSRGMLAEARRLHGFSSIRWISDSLPGLDKVFRLGLAFDLILLSAVWMHVAPTERMRAFRKLVMLLKPGGCMALTLRHGPSEPGRDFHDVSSAEIEHLARAHGAFVEVSERSRDQLGRADVAWTRILVRLPDDGTGALPLLRHIILNDTKSATYKLALLRVLSRIADGAAGLARYTDAGDVAVPLGLVALYWVRLFKPLLAAGLPQTATNAGLEGLGFVRDGFRQLGDVSHLDLRIGTSFARELASSLHGALRDAANTIERMPAHFTTYQNGAPVFPIARSGTASRPRALTLNAEYLTSFGELLMPLHLWRALQRYDAWIEPALVSEWAKLMKGYAEGQGRHIDDAQIAQSMAWSDPSRDVRIAREQAMRLIGSEKLYCVWTGRVLSEGSLDIDHCFPWAAWPCDDLWNLLPTHRAVNQRQKRDRLPGTGLLRSARERIEDWWGKAYIDASNQLLNQRFVMEAAATLPSVGEAMSLADIFLAMSLQQARLKNDQQIPVWEPTVEGMTGVGN
jgi:SAM-dependent methyltransferase